MTSDRIKEIQLMTAYPDSISVKNALLQVWHECAQEKPKLTESPVIGNTLLAAVSDKKIELIKEYLEPTGVTITELMDRNAFASLCQLLDAYLLEAVRNSR